MGSVERNGGGLLARRERGLATVALGVSGGGTEAGARPAGVAGEMAARDWSAAEEQQQMQGVRGSSRSGGGRV